MKIPYLLAPVIVAGLLATPAGATSERDYKKSEYLIIRHGLAPDKQRSLASHGAGENNDDAFHLWLMTEPAHRKLMALDGISADNNLDTAPDAYHAFWSKDSRHVGVAFRSSRHEVTLNLYTVDGRHVRRLQGPNLFREVTGRDVAEDDDLRLLNAIVEWDGGNRFTLKEFRSFVAADDRLAKLFGSYGRVAEKLPDGSFSIQFFVDAECELLPNDQYKIVSRRPGKPEDSETWWSDR